MAQARIFGIGRAGTDHCCTARRQGAPRNISSAACWRPDRFASERREGELFCGENYRMSELQGAVALAQIKQAKKFLAGYRSALAAITSQLRLPSGVLLQRVADPAGDACANLVLFMPSVEKTRQALAGMQTC